MSSRRTPNTTEITPRSCCAGNTRSKASSATVGDGVSLNPGTHPGGGAMHAAAESTCRKRAFPCTSRERSLPHLRSEPTWENGSWHSGSLRLLTRKRSQVQTLSRPPSTTGSIDPSLSAACQQITPRDHWNALSADQFGWLQAVLNRELRRHLTITARCATLTAGSPGDVLGGRLGRWDGEAQRR